MRRTLNVLRYFATGFLVLPLRFAPADTQTETMQLGGPREVVANIIEAAGVYAVAVSFYAVNCFDSTENKLINCSKALQYALVALGKKAGFVAGEEYSVDRLECIGADQSNDLFIASFKIPISGIKFVNSSHLAQGNEVGTHTASPHKANLSGELFSRYADYSQSIREVGVLVEEDFQTDARDLALDELATGEEEAGRDAARTYDRLRAEIAKDKLLLQYEVRQLSEEILLQQKATSTELNRIRSRHEQLIRQMLGH